MGLFSSTVEPKSTTMTNRVCQCAFRTANPSFTTMRSSTPYRHVFFSLCELRHHDDNEPELIIIVFVFVSFVLPKPRQWQALVRCCHGICFVYYFRSHLHDNKERECEHPHCVCLQNDNDNKRELVIIVVFVSKATRAMAMFFFLYGYLHIHHHHDSTRHGFFPSLESGHGFFYFSIANYRNTMTLIILLFLISFLLVFVFVGTCKKVKSSFL